MKNRSAVVTVLVAFAMVLPAMSFLASGSDVDTDDISTYQRDNLGNLRQMVIYDAILGLADSSGLPVDDDATGSAGDYYYEVPVSGITWSIDGVTDDAILEKAWISDAEKALLATKLDNPYAFWAWTSSKYLPVITVTAHSASSVTFKIAVEDCYAVGIKQMVTDAKAKVAEITVSGSNDAEKTKAINGIVTEYGYSEDFTKDPYARTVYALVPEDGSHKLSSEGAAALFKALCDKESVKCLQVSGKLIDDTKKYDWQWNYVSIDNTWFAYDSGYNTKYSDSEAWLAAGVYSKAGDKTFGVIHTAIMPSGNLILSYYGYGWPSSTDLWEQISEYLPWVLIGIICVILAIVLVIMARKGEI